MEGDRHKDEIIKKNNGTKTKLTQFRQFYGFEWELANITRLATIQVNQMTNKTICQIWFEKSWIEMLLFLWLYEHC
jgi:hypothetical protein